MFGAASASTGFVPACERARAVPSSSGVVSRAAGGSRPEGRPYISLRGRSEFSRVYRRGQRRRVGSIVVITAEGRPGPARVGFVAGRRIGGAVERNRAKRRLREAMAKVAVPEEMTYVVVAQPGVNQVGFDRLVAWLRSVVTTPAQPEEKT